MRVGFVAILWLALFLPVLAQVPPRAAEFAHYRGLFAAAADGDAEKIAALVAKGAPVDARDGYGRTPLIVAAHRARHDAMRALSRQARTRMRSSSRAIA